MLGAGVLFAWSLFAAAASDDPCTPVDSDGPVTPDLADVYRTVGDRERAVHSPKSASIAYREALRLDPHNRAARAGLSAVCKDLEGPTDQALQEGIREMDVGHLPEAAALFARAAMGPSRPDALLLEGICEYQLSHDDKALELLSAAAQVHDAQLQSTATFFLGLIKLRSGDAAQATPLFRSVQSDPTLGSLGKELARTSARDGRLTFSVLTAAGYDSNVVLTPDGTQSSTDPGDGLGEVSGAALYRPLGPSGPYARLNGLYRYLLRNEVYDLGQSGAAAGWQLGPSARYAKLEYGYDFFALGNAPYLSAHHLQAEGKWSWGNWSLGGNYAARFDSFRTPASALYSGLQQDASLNGAWAGSSALRVGLGYRVAHATAQISQLSWLEHGPQVDFHLLLRHGIRLNASGAFTLRGYDAYDADLSLQRADRYWDGSLSVQWDFSESWSIQGALGVRKAESNVAAFSYTRATGTVGVSYAVGVL